MAKSEHYLSAHNAQIRHRQKATPPIHSEPTGAVRQHQLLDDSGSSRILEYWSLLWCHKFKLGLFVLLGAIISVTIGFLERPVYRAYTSLEVLSLNQDFLNMRQASPVTTSDYLADSSELPTQIKILESDALMNSTIDKLSSTTDPNNNTSPLRAADWSKALGQSGSVSARLRRKELDRVGASLKVNVLGRTRMIELSVESTEPKLAAVFAKTIANEYIARNVEIRWQLIHQTDDWLNRELNSARVRLENSEAALQAYARKSGLIFVEPEPHTNVASEKLEQLQQALSTATTERIAKQSRYELAQSSPTNVIPEVLNDIALRDTAAKITELQRHVADLSVVYSPEYSKLKRAHAELAVLQAAFTRGRSDVLARLKNEYLEANRREHLLAGTYDAQVREVTGQGEKAIQYNILKRDADGNRQLYDTMLQQAKQSSIASAIRASNVRIVDPAEVPRKPFSPNLPRMGVLGSAIGLFFGLGIVMFGEYTDRTVGGPGDICSLTALPELGVIPTTSLVFGQRALRLTAGPQVVRRPSPRDTGPFADEHNQNGTADAVPWPQVPNIMAEAFRSALASILLEEGGKGNRPRVLVLTSASVADGKTTVVTNLAIAMAETKQTVLLIDADLRRPRIHSIFDLPNEYGLSNLLRQEDVSDKDVEGLTHEVGVPGLHVLTSGRLTNAAANLLYSRHLPALLLKFKRRYDLVLIDTPPVLHMPDARIIGRLADAVILVARAKQTTRDALIAVHQQFSDDRIPVLGTILNAWDPRKARAGYYAYNTASYENTYKGYAAIGRDNPARATGPPTQGKAAYRAG